MADLRQVIREMLAKGMTEEQIKANLAELGVDNVDEIYNAATEQLKSVSLGASAPRPAQAASSSQGMSEMSIQPLGGNPAPEAPVAPAPPQAQPAPRPAPQPEAPAAPQVQQEGQISMSSLDAPSEAESVAAAVNTVQPVASLPGSADEKLDEAIALLKALNDLNKKILDSNRDILLRLKG